MSNVIDFIKAKESRDSANLFDAIFAYTIDRLVEEGYDGHDVSELPMETVMTAMEHFIKEAAAEEK